MPTVEPTMSAAVCAAPSMRAAPVAAPIASAEDPENADRRAWRIPVAPIRPPLDPIADSADEFAALALINDNEDAEPVTCPVTVLPTEDRMLAAELPALVNGACPMAADAIIADDAASAESAAGATPVAKTSPAPLPTPARTAGASAMDGNAAAPDDDPTSDPKCPATEIIAPLPKAVDERRPSAVADGDTIALPTAVAMRLAGRIPVPGMAAVPRQFAISGEDVVADAPQLAEFAPAPESKDDAIALAAAALVPIADADRGEEARDAPASKAELCADPFADAAETVADSPAIPAAPVAEPVNEAETTPTPEIVPALDPAPLVID